jgi:glycine/sarcosine N-methyltransferase
MKFYKEISKVYDLIFPRDDTTLKYLCKNLNGNSKVLDLACGTGTYSIALAQKGHRVDGIDLGEDMIAQAKGKGGLFADFVVGDMMKIKNIFLEKKYDFIFCIGNSLVHLKNKERIEILIQDVFDMLIDEGALVIQIINYDRVIKNNVISLPTIDIHDKGIKFIRNYNYRKDENKIEFKTELLISKDGKAQRYENSIDLIALKMEEIKAIFEKVGFKDIEVFGDFTEEQFTDNSFALLIRGVKK